MLTIDPMHNLYLGTAKYVYQNVWLKLGKLHPSTIETINSRIESLKVPPNIRFNSRPRIDCKYTAEQWLIWVNYYSLFCLYDLLSDDEYECWRHFVLASRLLCKTPVTGIEISVADALLLKFCTRFESIYGSERVTPNMHLHCHLAECIKNFGPIMNFWCFSFDRFNGIIGNEPTNNLSIEAQLIKRILSDNRYLQLLSLGQGLFRDMDDTNAFTDVVITHATLHDSQQHQHLDDIVSASTDKFTCMPNKKSKMCTFSLEEVRILIQLYQSLYPSDHIESRYQPQTYRKIESITLNNQLYRSGQIVLARSVSAFPSSEDQLPQSITSDPNLRAAVVKHFILYTLPGDDDCELGNSVRVFAVVDWLQVASNQLKDKVGKPYVAYCNSLFEISPNNFLVPIDYISTVLLSCTMDIEEDRVLLTVP